MCTVSFRTRAGDRKQIRKKFKFVVIQPLEIKPKPYNVEVGPPQPPLPSY
jgi:hypothetical protein